MGSKRHGNYFQFSVLQYLEQSINPIATWTDCGQIWLWSVMRLMPYWIIVAPWIYIYIIDAFSRKDSLGIIITIAVCFYCERGVYGTRVGDAVAGIGILRNITVSRTTILLTYLSSAVRCHVTDRVKLCYTWECWYFECHCVGSNCTIYVSLYLILIFFNLLKSFTG